MKREGVIKSNHPCPLCGDFRAFPVVSGRDNLFDNPETFQMARCFSCGIWRLVVPLDDKEKKKYYPPEYAPYKDSRPVKKIEKLSISHMLRKWYFLWVKKGRPNVAYLPLSQMIKTIFAVLITPFQIYRFNPFAFGVDGKKVLDVGCADGHFLAEMAELGWAPVGVEMNRVAAKRCETRKITVYKGTFPNKELSIKNKGAFDLVTMRQVLEHFKNPAKALEAANKLLKPGGFICIWIPVTGGLAPSVFGSYWYNLDLPRHQVIFTKKTLISMLFKCGFSAEKVFSFSSTKAITKSYEIWLKNNYDGTGGIKGLLFKGLNTFAFPVTKIMDIIGKGDNLVVIARKVDKVLAPGR